MKESKAVDTYDSKKERAQLRCVFFISTGAIFCVGIIAGCVMTLCGIKISNAYIDLLALDLAPFLTLGFGKAGSVQINDFFKTRLNKLTKKQ